MSSEAPSGRPSEAATGLETFDDLADLFLGDELAPTPRASGDQSVHVSSLIVGHLPVIAAPWISQHARDLARTMMGPVAVLSRSGDRTTLDLYNAPPLSEQHTIEGAIDQAVSARVRRWLIRTDAVSELSAYDLDRVDSVTMLTGADDAAVVSAYRAIKGLVADTSELDERPMVLNLAVMGSERTKARSAAEKIRKAARSFLQTGLADVSMSEKIAAGGSSVRTFDGQSSLDLSDILGRIPRQLAAIAMPQPESKGPLRLAGHVSESVEAKPVQVQALNAPIQSIPAQSESMQRETAHASGATAESAPGDVSASRLGPIENNSGANASMLGLTHIEARCPFADDIELAVDHEGRAHLIGLAEGQDMARPLESLQIASDWIGAHLTLLSSATSGKIKANPPLAASRHLIVDHAASARRILDSDIKVYVRAQGQQETLCVPLN